MTISRSILLNIQHLSKKIPMAQSHTQQDLTILHDMAFQVYQGERLAIIGESGSGKSTLLGLLAGMDTPSQGSIYHHDIDIAQLTEDARAAWRAKHVGFVFQSFQLLDHLTALENVQLPLELLGGSNTRQKALSMLERVGLSHRLQHYPNVLSGGEQQRVALARAFVTEPRILFADEPTGSLDTATGELVQSLMFELNHVHETTLILVTHDQHLAGLCDRQLVLNAGHLLSVSDGE